MTICIFIKCNVLAYLDIDARGDSYSDDVDVFDEKYELVLRSAIAISDQKFASRLKDFEPIFFSLHQILWAFFTTWSHSF